MDKGTKVLLWSLGILVFFVVLTIVELLVLRRMGFDLIAHLQLTLKEGKTKKFFFEAFGAVAFVMVQPFAFFWLFSSTSDRVKEILRDTASQVEVLLQ
jgi:hypothetical protein